MDLRNRSINKFDVETLFRDVLNQSQIQSIGNLLKLLGMYVFMNREQLDILGERHYGSKVGLSFLQKAIKYNLVSELQSENDDHAYYFQLKSGGFAFLEAINFSHRKLPLDAAASERAKILAINNFLIKNDHLLTNFYGFGVYEPLFTQKSVALCLEMPKKKLALEVEEMGLDFIIEKMELEEMELDAKTKGNVESLL